MDQSKYSDLLKCKAYRESLDFDLNTRRKEIDVYFVLNSDLNEFVVTDPGLDVAKTQWLSKYKQELPENITVCPASLLSANIIQYTGKNPLTKEELNTLKSFTDESEFNLSILWLMVDGLGWRLGKPVPEDHPGWIAIWAEDDECVGVVDSVRSVLGMPKVEYEWFLGDDNVGHRVMSEEIHRALRALHPIC